MVALSFPRGLHTGVGGSTPKHVHDALNVFEFGDNIIGRGGAGWVEDASRFVVGLGGLAYFAATSNGSTPASLTTTLPFTCTGERYLFFGYTAPFDRIRVTGTVSSLADDGDVYTAFPKVEYWNGSAWTEIKVARAWAPTYAIISGSDTSISRPCLAGTDDGQPGTGNLLSFAFNPPSDWATQTIDGDTLYILRVTLDATLNGNDAVFASGSAVHDPAVTPERVLCILPYNRRDGAGHQFVAFQSGDKTNANFYIYLDGTEQTWDTDIVRSAKVDETSDVWAVYHEATDHVYFRVAGVGWFAMPGGGGTIEQMDATGQGTIYESLDRGLRPAIPAPLPVTLFEGRLWAGEDGWLRWGASDVYPDVWPNEFERFVGDPLVCLVGTKTWMAAFSKRACYRVVNDGSADGYVVEKMLDGVGCVGPRAACAVGDVVFFLNTDGVYAMDGSGAIVKQSGAINEWWKSARAGRLSRAVMIYHGGYDQVRLFYPSNEERTILDEALYFNAEGYEYREAGVQMAACAFWPQGRKQPTDYGFDATCVVMDNRTSEPVMLVGDAHNQIWVHDVGDCDNGPPVYRKLRSAPINFDSAQNVVVRWVNVALENTGDVALTVTVRPDMNEGKDRDVAISAYVAADARLVDDATLVNNTDTVLGEDVSLIREVSFTQKCRAIQVGFEQEQELPLSLVAMELKVNRQGERGGR